MKLAGIPFPSTYNWIVNLETWLAHSIVNLSVFISQSYMGCYKKMLAIIEAVNTFGTVGAVRTMGIVGTMGMSALKGLLIHLGLLIQKGLSDVGTVVQVSKLELLALTCIERIRIILVQ
jgi:hypothetical protein